MWKKMLLKQNYNQPIKTKLRSTFKDRQIDCEQSLAGLVLQQSSVTGRCVININRCPGALGKGRGEGPSDLTGDTELLSGLYVLLLLHLLYHLKLGM